MFLNLLKSCRIVRAKNAVAAGTTTQTSSTFDSQGATSVTAIGLIGTITATGVPAFKLQQGDASDGSDAADITGATVAYTDADSNKIALIECLKLTKRYVTVVCTRGTANAVLDGILLLFMGNRTEPQSSETTVVGSVCIAPDAF